MGKVLLVACTNVGRQIIETIYKNENIYSELVGVVNLNSEQALNKANYDSYHDLHIKYKFPIHYCNNINDSVTVEWIQEKKPDIILQSGWSQKFKDELLNLPKFGCIGEHPAPLPKGRGAACVNWAILTGEKKWGDSFFHMVSAYDAGELYDQEFFEIYTEDTVKTVYDKVALSAGKIVSRSLDSWTEGKFESIEQDLSKVTHYHRRRPSDGLFNFSDNAEKIYDFIRAQTKPYPGAFFMYDSSKVIVWQARCLNGFKKDDAGKIVQFENRSIYVSCNNESIIEIIYVQEEGYPCMWAKDWAAMRGLKIGDRLGN